MLRKAGGEEPSSDLLQMLFSKDTKTQEDLRAFYAHAARFHEYKRKVIRQERLQQQRKQQQAEAAQKAQTSTPSGQ
ncbi:MAG: hypothetical protein R3E67_07930 [Pseudomonadales bacterium]